MIFQNISIYGFHHAMHMKATRSNGQKLQRALTPTKLARLNLTLRDPNLRYCVKKHIYLRSVQKFSKTYALRATDKSQLKPLMEQSRSKM